MLPLIILPVIPNHVLNLFQHCFGISSIETLKQVQGDRLSNILGLALPAMYD